MFAVFSRWKPSLHCAVQYVLLNRSYEQSKTASHTFQDPTRVGYCIVCIDPLAHHGWLLHLICHSSYPRWSWIHKKLGEEADAMASFFAPAPTIGAQSGHILQQTALHTMLTTEIPIQENVACNRCLSLQYCQVASTIILTAVCLRIAIAISGGPEKMRERYDSRAKDGPLLLSACDSAP